MSLFTDKTTNFKAQGTVEAAIMIPVFLLLLLLLLQPAIILYDTIVMKAAVSETCRLLATSSDASSKQVDDFVRRRLSAIPQVDIFHVHSNTCSYVIETSGGEGQKISNVAIENKIRMLPLISGALDLMGATEGGELTLRQSQAVEVQPSWY